MSSPFTVHAYVKKPISWGILNFINVGLVHRFYIYWIHRNNVTFSAAFAIISFHCLLWHEDAPIFAVRDQLWYCHRIKVCIISNMHRAVEAPQSVPCNVMTRCLPVTCRLRAGDAQRRQEEEQQQRHTEMNTHQLSSSQLGKSVGRYFHLRRGKL